MKHCQNDGTVDDDSNLLGADSADQFGLGCSDDGGHTVEAVVGLETDRNDGGPRTRDDGD